MKQDIRRVVVSAMKRAKMTQWRLSKETEIPQETLSSWLIKRNDSIGSRRLERIFVVLNLVIVDGKLIPKE